MGSYHEFYGAIPGPESAVRVVELYVRTRRDEAAASVTLGGGGGARYKVLHDFQAEEEGEMSVVKGEVVRVCIVETDDVPKDGWVLAKSSHKPGENGYVPEAYLQRLPDV